MSEEITAESIDDFHIQWAKEYDKSAKECVLRMEKLACNGRHPRLMEACTSLWIEYPGPCNFYALRSWADRVASLDVRSLMNRQR